jgi:HSP20 family protein
MAIVRWDPFRSFWRWPSIWDEEDWGITTTDNLDVYETENSVIVKASVAGVDPKKVDVTFEKGILTIQAVKEEEEKKGKKYYKKASRSYSYRVAVPGNIDSKKEPKAEIDKGIVTVTFKKTAEAKPKKIEVKNKSAK